jgi:hypothetical protein
VYSRGRVDVVLATCAEVIEHSDLMAGGDKRVHDVGTNESGPTSHQDSHGD